MSRFTLELALAVWKGEHDCGAVVGPAFEVQRRNEPERYSVFVTIRLIIA